jgi:hypothetical protein
MQPNYILYFTSIRKEKEVHFEKFYQKNCCMRYFFLQKKEQDQPGLEKAVV